MTYCAKNHIHSAHKTVNIGLSFHAMNSENTYSFKNDENMIVSAQHWCRIMNIHKILT